MRILAAVATIAACVVVSVAVHDGGAVAPMLSPQWHATVDKQAVRGKPGGGAAAGNDSCRWANDHECDDPDIGTGACQLGTDYSDCRRLREGREDDSCRWARDGECDEPNFGTGACTQGTDRTDCGSVAWLRNQNDRCATSFNGVCEEPGEGRSGTCAARTDRSDCLGRNRPRLISDHFFGRDDRVRVNEREAPWRFMGRFTNSAGEACTATLIGRDVIVTAAHCVHTDNGRDAHGQFVAAGNGGTARTVAYLVSENFDYARFGGGDDIDGLDWALLRLDQPLGDRLGFAGVRNLTGEGAAAARAANLLQAGYSWDTGDTLSANINCHIVDPHNDGTFAHECDTTRGDSGSAFVVRNGDRFDVIGVDSNFRSNPGGPFIYIAVSAASFQPYVADFVAGRTGIPVDSAGGGDKPKQAPAR